jgi:hypothetical protein
LNLSVIGSSYKIVFPSGLWSSLVDLTGFPVDSIKTPDDGNVTPFFPTLQSSAFKGLFITSWVNSTDGKVFPDLHFCCFGLGINFPFLKIGSVHGTIVPSGFAREPV